jgi:hypothetical protein
VSRVDNDRSFESLFLTEDMVGRTVVMGSEDDCIVTIGAVSGDNYLADSTSVSKLHRPVILVVTAIAPSQLITC